ncbi:uncharacterized protein LOC131072442 isoform X2 [Cryptomeria japonica]|uniref:uncharacterized protein LOC131072442 isoform X2 n=1 Tax=Cryptomeria japonica TaxID=3369 RepID=UPI0027DA4A0A|nr:uncharacterized protein LOC131072442 isoform X2 [Cryptomeria japonica]
MNNRYKLHSSGGSAGRTFDLRAIAAGSNGELVTSTNRACRVTVKIYQAKDLKKRLLAYDVSDLFFKLRLEDITHKSREIKGVVDQNGVLVVNQNFTFDVKDFKSAQLSVQVYGKGLFGFDELIGACQNIPVKLLMDIGNGFSEGEGKWYDLFIKDGKRKLPGKPEDLSAWIPISGAYQIMAIGTQECDYPPRPPFTDCGKDWLETLRKHVGRQYRVIRYTSRGQMRLIIFVRDDAEKAISDVDSGSEATGVANVMANKGGVCISFKFWDTGLCFINCHFAAHDGQCEIRNSNYRDIAGQLQIGLQSMDILNQFHHVFWIGDLNYRLDFGKHEEKPLTPQRRFWSKTVKQILDGGYRELLQYDELRREKASSRVLHGFKEGVIQFPPTYKMQRDSIQMYDQKRMPAWCDRVLWRTLQGCHTDLLSYTYSPQIVTSDHKPVSATFGLTAYALPSSKSEALNDSDDKRWHVRFTSLRAKNLRASHINGFSDPYISFIGPNLAQSFRSKVKYQTLNPVWNPLKELPTLVLNIFPLQRLEKEYLMVQVHDHDSQSTKDILGYAAIPLASAVTAFNKGPRELSTFRVELSHCGLPAGTLEGGMKLTWERNVIKRRSRFAREIMAKTLSLRNSLRKTMSVDKFAHEKG